MVFCLFGDQYMLWNFILRYVWKLVCFTSPISRHRSLYFDNCAGMLVEVMNQLNSNDIALLKCISADHCNRRLSGYGNHGQNRHGLAIPVSMLVAPRQEVAKHTPDFLLTQPKPSAI